MSQVSEIIVNWTPETSGRVAYLQIQSRIAGTSEWTEQAASVDASLGEFRFGSNAPATDVEVRMRTRMVDGVFSPWSTDHIVTAPVTVPYLDLTGTPSKLEDINQSEGTKLGGIAPGADVTGQNTALNTVNVGDSKAQDIADAAKAAAAAVKNAAGQIVPITSIIVRQDNLEQTYGTTVAASASATAADNSKKAAEAATSTAQLARDAAQAAKTLADTAVTNAQAARDAAISNASTASTRAGEAASSATAANTAKIDATTAAGNAKTYQDNAVVSARDALASQNIATTQAGVSASSATAAINAAATSLPQTFENGGQFHKWLSTGAVVVTYPVVDGIAVLQAVGGNYGYLCARAWQPLVAGEKWHVRVELRNAGTAATLGCGIGYYYGDTNAVDGAATGFSSANLANNTTTYNSAADGVWKTIEYDIILPASPVGSYIRPAVYIYTGNPSSTTIQVRRFAVTNVTQSALAQAAASAAATSASTASTKATDAGTSATAANTSKTDAQTAAGQAKTYQDNAASSASTATTQANTATTQAGVTTSTYQSALQIVGNEAFDNGLDGWEKIPAGGTGTPVLVATGTGRANVISASNFVAAGYVSKRRYPVTSTDQKFELSGGFRKSGGLDAGNNLYVGFVAYDSTGANIRIDGYGNYPLAFKEQINNGGWLDRKVIVSKSFTNNSPFVGSFGRGGSCVIPAAAVSIAPVFFFNDPNAQNEAYQIDYLTLEDVTSRENAAANATAAATSASTATTQASNAGTSATAANTAKTNAETAAGNAKTYQDNAAVSASTATTQANTATTQAGVSASSAKVATQAADFPLSFAQKGTLYTNGSWGNGGALLDNDFVASTAGNIYTKAGSFGINYARAVPGKRRLLRYQVKFRAVGGDATYSADYEYSNNLTGAQGGTFSGFSTATPAQGWIAVDYLIDNRTGDTLYFWPLLRGTASGTIEVEYFRVLDITDTQAAADSATAAATSASTASTKADAAGTSATAAQTAKTAAETASGNAKTYQDNASTSASNALGSANTATSAAGVASTSSTAAAQAAAITFPSNFEQDDRFWTTDYTHAPGTGVVGSFVTVSGVGRVWQSSGAATINVLAPKGFVRAVPGRTYRTTVRARVITNSTNSAPGAGYNHVLYGYNAAGSADGFYSTYAPQNPTVATGWVDFVDEATMPAGATVFIRPLFVMNNNNSNAVWQVASFLWEDITASKNAAASASAAATSASSASTKADSAGTSAAAAQTSATVAASVGNGSINANPLFANYTGGLVGDLPNNWNVDPQNVGAGSRVAGANGIGYAWRLPSTANQNSYAAVTTPAGSIAPYGWYVIEATVVLNSGTFVGAGVLFRVTNPSIDYTIPFAASPDNTGVAPGNGVVGNTYRFSKLVQVAASASASYLYAMTHWQSLGSVQAANDITWQRCAVRPASDAEIQAKAALDMSVANSAAVSSQAGALASLQGRSTAYLQSTVNAGTNAEAFVTIRADSNVPVNAPVTFMGDVSSFTIDGRNVTKISGSSAAWDRGVYSTQMYTGRAYLSFQFGAIAPRFMIGLNGDPAANSSYDTIDYAFYTNGNGAIIIHESGVNTGAGPTSFKLTDVFSITYAGTTVTYRVNGTIVRQVETSANRPFALDSSFYDLGGQAKNIVFAAEGPISASSVAVGATEFAVYSGVEGGGYIRALSVYGGNATFDGTITARTGVLIGDGTWRVAVSPKDYQVSDGTVISYGYNLGRVPVITFGPSPVALNSGEVYRAFAENSTATGFTARLQIVAAPTTVQQSIGPVTSAGAQSIDIAKSAPDAATGTYTFYASGTMTGNATFYIPPDKQNCVHIDAYVGADKLAGDVAAGDTLLLLNDSFDGYFECGAQRAFTASAICYRITSKSGITLTLSESTPVTLKGGEMINVLDVLGKELPVLDRGVFGWEEIINIEKIGEQPVQNISVFDGTFAAGDQQGRMIFTHNLPKN